MTKVDQFESVFRAATREVYRFEPLRVRKALVVTDLEREAAIELGDTIRRFLSVLESQPELDWRYVEGSEFASVGELLELVARETPDLICTYRHLHSDAWRWPYSLGEALDVLTQATPHPVLVVPHPHANRSRAHALRDTSTVMAIADRLTGDDRLVTHAAGLVERDGRLILSHIEDARTFERYLGIISKIPSIDTDVAREEIEDRLLDEAREYIRSCAAALEEAQITARVEELVTMGRRLEDCKRLIEQHEIDLLVLNTKDEDQLAMHGLAYPLAVELRGVPLLLL